MLCIAALAGCAEQADKPLHHIDLDNLPPGSSLAVEVESRPWKYPYGTGQVLTTPHYTVYVSTNNERLVRILPGFLEAAHANYSRITHLADRPAGPRMDVYVLPSRRQWADLTKSVFGPRASALNLQAGGYSYKGVGVFWDLRGLATLSIASHEGMHQFLYHRLKNRLPVFIEEALATSGEGFDLRDNRVAFTPTYNTRRYQDVRTAIVQGRWIPIRELMLMDGRDVTSGTHERALGWYGQVWALAYFLRTSEKYRGGFRRMLQDAEAGRFHGVIHVPPAALAQLQRRFRIYNRRMARPLFEHYLTQDIETFEREYLAFARKLANLPPQKSLPR